MPDIIVTPRRPSINVSINTSNNPIDIDVDKDAPPKINGVSLIGDKTMTEILHAGLIIDGKNAKWVSEGE